ncbi:class F sortase [Candidatus Saccharibacteria bacterium]|nr:class F sortase [Candidatus Saccharibacteria bacterium]
MKRVLLWSSLVFTSAAMAVMTGFGVNTLKTEVVNATGETGVVLELASPNPVDQTARAKYLADRATETSTTHPTTKTAKTTQLIASKSATTQSATPTCDRLIIPKINLDTCLATVGLTTSGAVDVHASLPAWFNQSSRAGTNSGKYPATFIDGHRNGIFKNLKQLVVEDTVTVAFMSGELYTYTVRAIENIPLTQVDMLKVLSIYNDANQGLNLMTCDGAYNANMGTAERRLILYATR